MEILIKETGVLRNLSFVDWKDGKDYSLEILRSAKILQDLIFDPEQNLYLMSESLYEKWSSFFSKRKDVQKLCKKLNLFPISKLSDEALVHP